PLAHGLSATDNILSRSPRRSRWWARSTTSPTRWASSSSNGHLGPHRPMPSNRHDLGLREGRSHREVSSGGLPFTNRRLRRAEWVGVGGPAPPPRGAARNEQRTLPPRREAVYAVQRHGRGGHGRATGDWPADRPCPRARRGRRRAHPPG